MSDRICLRPLPGSRPGTAAFGKDSRIIDDIATKTPLKSIHDHHHFRLPTPHSRITIPQDVLARSHPPQEVPDSCPYVNCLPSGPFRVRKAWMFADIFTVKPMAPFIAAGM